MSGSKSDLGRSWDLQSANTLKIRILNYGVFAGMLSLAPATAKPPLDMTRLAEVEELVVRDGQDTGPPFASNEVERIAREKMIDDREKEERERLQEIRSQPGMKPYLFELLDKHYFRQPKNAVYPPANAYRVLDAIAIRVDLEKGDVQIIADELQRILNTPYSPADSGGKGFVSAAIPILKADRSPENERILIGLLARADNINWRGVKVRAAKLLASIGSEKSVPYLADAEEWAERIAGNEPALRTEVIEPISQAYMDLKRRLEKERSLSMHRTGPSGTATTENGELGMTAQKKGLSGWLNDPRWIVMILVGLIVSGFWLLWRKRAAQW